MNKKLLVKLFKLDGECFKLFVLGLSSFFLFAPFYFFFLGFLILSYFGYSLYRQSSYIGSFNKSFYFYLGFFLGNCYWISFSFLVNKSFVIFFPFVFFLIPAFGACFSALFLALLFFIKDRYKLSLKEYYFSLAFLLFIHEYLRGHFIPLVDLKGLPWNILGYAFLTDINLAQFSSIVGVYGLSFIIIYIYLSPIFFFEKNSRNLAVKICMVNLLLIVALYNYGAMRQESTEMQEASSHKFSLLHSNISKHHGHSEAAVIANVDKAISLIQGSEPADIVVVPEGTVSVLTDRNYNPAFEYLLEYTKGQSFNNIIIGSPRAGLKKSRYHFYNTMFYLDKEQNFLGYYDKVNLVPFGEYNPLLKIIPPLAAKSNFTEGERRNPVIKLADNLLAVPLICYDGIFPGKFSQDGDFLLNITNDIWFTRKVFGKNVSVAPWQHFDLIRMRSIEEGKPLIRVANYGITAVVDSFGNVEKKLTFNDEEQALLISLPGKLKYPSFYNQYRDLIIYLISIINAAGLFIYFQIRNRRRS